MVNMDAMKDPVLDEALQLFVYLCRDRRIGTEVIVSADQFRHPWVFTGVFGEGWSVEVGADPIQRFVVDAEGTLHHAARTWTLRKVPREFQVPEGDHHLVEAGPFEEQDIHLRDSLLQAFVRFLDEHEAR